MTLVAAVKNTFIRILDATPFSSLRKRKREPVTDDEVEQPQEPSPKRPAAPGSTKKALQFGQEQDQQAGRAGGAIPTVVPLATQQQQQQQQQQGPSLLGPPPLPAAKLRQVGAGLVKQATQPPTVYNSPQPGASRRVFPSLTRGHAAPAVSYTPARSSKHLLGPTPWKPRGAPAPQWPGVQHSSLKPPLGQATVLAQAPSGPARSTAIPTQPASRRFTPYRPAALDMRAMGGTLAKLTKSGRHDLHEDPKGRDLLMRGTMLSLLEMKSHREHIVPTPTEVVDLTADEQQAVQQQQQQPVVPSQLGRRQQQQQALGPLPPALESSPPAAAAAGSLLASLAGEPPFTTSLLRTEARLRYEAPLQQEKPALLALHDAEAMRRSDEDYQRQVEAADAAKQRALVATAAGLKVAKTLHTALEQQQDPALAKDLQLRTEIQAIQDQLLHGRLRRQAARSPEAPKQLLPPKEEEEEEVVIVSSDEEEEEHEEVLQVVSSAAASESEEVEHLAALSVSEGLPELPEEYYHAYADVLRKDGDPAERLVMHDRSQIEIRRKDMACMAPLEWLNDEVINLYMALLLERDMRSRGKGVFPKCHFFSTFFLNKLYKDTGYKYKDVARWTLQRRLKMQGQMCDSILDCDRIIVPVHQGMHWVCAMIDIPNKTLYYYDSLKGSDRECLDSLAQYVADEYQNKRNQTVDTSSWDRVFPKNIPQQHNGCDCGVFTLLFAEHAGRGAPMVFSQCDIDYFRIKIVNDILNLRVD